MAFAPSASLWRCGDCSPDELKPVEVPYTSLAVWSLLMARSSRERQCLRLRLPMPSACMGAMSGICCRAEMMWRWNVEFGRSVFIVVTLERSVMVKRRVPVLSHTCCGCSALRSASCLSTFCSIRASDESSTPALPDGGTTGAS